MVARDEAEDYCLRQVRTFCFVLLFVLYGTLSGREAIVSDRRRIVLFLDSFSLGAIAHLRGFSDTWLQNARI